jgi:3-dehydroquinate synthase
MPTLPADLINLDEFSNISHYVIITDDAVRKIYGEQLQEMLQNQCGSSDICHRVELLSFPAGEQSKSQETKTHLEHAMFEAGCNRDTLVIALGGGVVGDIAGFVAATFMRGIPYIQIPTTLLAMVDSSVGGKTAINTPYGKNLVGAFWPAKKMILRPELLASLSREHILDGLVESVKIFITHSKSGLGFVEENFDEIMAKDPAILKELIERSVSLKEYVVGRDKREQGERVLLNFGHTAGHAIELLSDYKIMHGHAVALGLLIEAKMAQLSGFLPEEDFKKVEAIIFKLGFKPEELKYYPADKLFNAMQLDKKSIDGHVRYVVLTGIGATLEEGDKFAHDLDPAILIQALDYYVNPEN